MNNFLSYDFDSLVSFSFFIHLSYKKESLKSKKTNTKKIEMKFLPNPSNVKQVNLSKGKRKKKSELLSHITFFEEYVTLAILFCSRYLDNKKAFLRCQWFDK